MSKKKFSDDQIRRECLSFAISRLQLSDFDTVENHIAFYENLCKKHEKKHDLDISLFTTLIEIAEDNREMDNDTPEMCDIVYDFIIKMESMIHAKSAR